VNAKESLMTASIRIGLLCAILSHLLPAQSVQANQKPQYHPIHTVISPVRQIVSALGERVQKQGNERVVMTGTLNRAGVVSTVQVIREMPGFLRVDEQGGKGRSLVFDINSLRGATVIDDDDEGLAESLQNDTAEAFLGSFGPGASVRRLGDRFKVKDEMGFGAEVDIYEVVSSVGVKRAKQVVTKRFMFDSSTGLLRRVVYGAQQSGRAVTVQTVLSDYSSAGGYMLPGKIARVVDGKESFVFTRNTAAIQAAGKDNAFISPGR
jgi:hypothetical protein